jgi:outer membrane protein OmpA-like peptidoglycan-associated protein
MASKKYSFLAGVICMLGTSVMAQTTTTTTRPASGYDVADSSVIPSKRMPQHTEFMNATYNYPAKPRNQWEIGIKFGTLSVIGDVDGKFLSPAGGIHVRKALGHLVSLRLQYMYGVAKGQNWKPATGYTGKAQNPWEQLGYAGQPVYYNYKTNVQDLSLEAVFALNNIQFYKSEVKTLFYLFGGVGISVYDARVNALNGTAMYTFAGANAIEPKWDNKSDIKDALDEEMDDDYETRAETDGDARRKMFGNSANFVGSLGGGVAFKLSNKINLALENKVTITKDDLYDGQRWAEQGDLTRDFDIYNYLSLGLNINIGSKAVQPLWWLNPLDYAYQEIRKPRLMQLPKPVLPDADGDGVTDQFDQEQTPAGCPVDTHGVSLDTDGDGVPDCRDKEKVTPTGQPVDADGVGKAPCPAPECLEGLIKKDSSDCAAALGALPSVSFSGNTISLTNDAKGLLASVAARMRQNPECNVVVTGYCASSKPQQQRSYDRVNAIINYLVEKEGISADRFFWNYGQEGGDCNTVDLRAAAADEQGQRGIPQR